MIIETLLSSASSGDLALNGFPGGLSQKARSRKASRFGKFIDLRKHVFRAMSH